MKKLLLSILACTSFAVLADTALSPDQIMCQGKHKGMVVKITENMTAREIKAQCFGQTSKVKDGNEVITVKSPHEGELKLYMGGTGPDATLNHAMLD